MLVGFRERCLTQKAGKTENQDLALKKQQHHHSRSLNTKFSSYAPMT